VEDQSPSLVKALTKEEKSTLESSPAVFSNRFFAATTATGMKLVFVEQHNDEGPAVFRSGVFLSFEDCLALSELLTKLLENQEILQNTDSKKTVEKND
jgi:3-deoxy-D-manno-octulosonic acid (KDO) 8-phosphate synthase